jgi:Methyltransferase domain
MPLPSAATLHEQGHGDGYDRAVASVELQPHRSSVVKRARGFVRYATRSMRRRLTSRKTPVGMAANALLGEGHVILVDYPPTARAEPRYGYGRPPHPRLSELLGQGDREYEGVLEEFKGYTDDLFAIPVEGTDPGEPRWRNGYLFGLDGVSLYCFTRKYSPRRYIEIGSGNSTLFVDRARRDGEIDMEIISVDPYPRREIDAICDSVVREPIETTNLDIFDGLKSGDMVFLDGTHRVFMNSDAAVFFLDVLPELPAGVLVGIHDIHLPDDYRPDHADRHYSEQYLLASYLLGESPWIRPILPCWYVSHHPRLGSLASSLVPEPFRQARSPHGVIFWLMTQPRS